MKKFKLIGVLAHGRKANKITDFTEIITAPDIIKAMEIYQKKLRGVKKSKLIEIREL